MESPHSVAITERLRDRVSAMRFLLPGKCRAFEENVVLLATHEQVPSQVTPGWGSCPPPHFVYVRNNRSIVWIYQDMLVAN